MPTSSTFQARGTAIGTSDGSFSLITKLKDTGEQLLGIGTVNFIGPPWESQDVVITFDNLDQVTGKHIFRGSIGEGEFRFTADNGVEACGRLTSPVVPGIEVSGVVTWDLS
ncbi:hypothetical protein RhiLY_12223 [Ceratobasidium sp. AG-Ba]|nr:hypothetical protein RhiLY_12223 [Ceratobasidium sp. AG-Ba]